MLPEPVPIHRMVLYPLIIRVGPCNAPIWKLKQIGHPRPELANCSAFWPQSRTISNALNQRQVCGLHKVSWRTPSRIAASAGPEKAIARVVSGEEVDITRETEP